MANIVQQAAQVDHMIQFASSLENELNLTKIELENCDSINHYLGKLNTSYRSIIVEKDLQLYKTNQKFDLAKTESKTLSRRNKVLKISTIGGVLVSSVLAGILIGQR